MKIYDKEKMFGIWIMKCPKCGAIQASASEYDWLPESTTCDCDSENSKREIIGKKIAELRKQKGISQAKLASLTGLDAGHIARIELGRYSVGIDVLSKIGNALNCNLDFIEK